VSGPDDAVSVRAAVDAMPDFVVATEGPELRVVAMSASVRGLAERTDWLGAPLAEVYPELAVQGVLQMYEEVYRTGEPIVEPAWRLQLAVPGGGEVTDLYVHWAASPWQRADGASRGVIGTGRDVTEQVRAQRRAEEEAAETGRRYREAQDVVRELQQALLPSTVPVLPRLDVAARYLVAGAEQSAGGDWFDVRPLADGRTALVVGDVVGHGVAAAAVMSQLRAVLDEALQTSPGPADAVARVERFARSVPGARFATVVVVVVDPVSGAAEYLTRGHPAPVLVDASGTGRQLLGSGGGPLGADPGGPAMRTQLADGEVLVLFSDGLVERADRPYGVGVDELVHMAEAATAGQLWPAGTVSSAAERICTDAVELLTRRGFDDDVTVLAVALHPPVPPLRVTARSTGPDLARLRDALGEWLSALRCEPADQHAVQLAVGEAVDNAVEHGFRYVPTGTVVLQAHLDDAGRVHVRVDDEGMWQAPRPGPQHRGRGLMVIDSIGDDVVVDGQPGGTTVSFTRPLTRPARTEATSVDARPTDATTTREDFRTWLVGEPAALHVAGPVDAMTTAALRAALAGLSHGDNTPATVDLSEVTHLTSTGVAALAEMLGEPGRDHPAVLLAPTGTTAAYVLDLAGLPRTAADS
jgi:serine phosphatase RsbU (regulator of sigma subunit)/anti-sigma regulatory factor (Ser/Thr protein kinase)/ABC-type transporter Mla MlaB component